MTRRQTGRAQGTDASTAASRTKGAPRNAVPAGNTGTQAVPCAAKAAPAGAASAQASAPADDTGTRAAACAAKAAPRGAATVGDGGAGAACEAAKRAPLGAGLRLVQLAFAANLLLSYANAAATNPLYFTYDLSLFRGVFEAAVSVLAIWLIQSRCSAARPLTIVGVAAAFVLMQIDVIACGAGLEIANAVGRAAAVALIGVEVVTWASIAAYMALSKHARAVLTVPLAEVVPAVPTLTHVEPVAKRMRTWPFWRDIGIYFIVFSFLGHWAEILFCLLIRAGVFMGDYDPSNHMLWDQWLYPFNAEGIALALVVILLFPFKQWLMKRTEDRIAIALPLSFIANALACTSIDFTLGITCNADYQLWDYRALPFNFMGQIVLQNSLVYSIAATLIVWVVYPLMDRAMARLPRWFADALFFALAAGYGFLALLHFMYLGPNGWVVG